jgi:hypothetical protein
MRLYYFLLFALLPFLFSFSPNSEPSSVAEIQAQYRLLVDLHEQEQISPAVFDERATYLQALAKERFDLSLEGLAMEQVVTVQRINWIATALYVGAALLVFVLLGPLLRKLWRPLRRFFRHLWALDWVRKALDTLARIVQLLWEPLAYAVLIACLVFYPYEWLLVFAAFALGSLISYSCMSRAYTHKDLPNAQPDDTESTPASYERERKSLLRMGRLASWLVTFVWVGLAYYFDHAWIGFMAVAAFVSSMGFVLMLWPHTIGLGFKQHEASYILPTTIFMLLLTVVSVLIFHTDYLPALSQLRISLRMYEVGLLSLVPLVYFLGLGYTAFFTFGRKAALYKQVLARALAFIIGYLSVAAGLLYGVGSLFWIGLFFMVWFTADLYFELVYRKIDVVWSGLVLAGVLGAGGWWLNNNLSTVLEFAAKLGW